uniref:Uncharacterized protein n=1 Tax=Anopheles dirus TaxID=7168 RepID=A0A182NYN7_9DIPT
MHTNRHGNEVELRVNAFGWFGSSCGCWCWLCVPSSGTTASGAFGCSSSAYRLAAFAWRAIRRRSDLVIHSDIANDCSLTADDETKLTVSWSSSSSSSSSRPNPHGGSSLAGVTGGTGFVPPRPAKPIAAAAAVAAA